MNGQARMWATIAMAIIIMLCLSWALFGVAVMLFNVAPMTQADASWALGLTVGFAIFAMFALAMSVTLMLWPRSQEASSSIGVTRTSQD